jgi:hypothetical protein
MRVIDGLPGRRHDTPFRFWWTNLFNPTSLVLVEKTRFISGNTIFFIFFNYFAKLYDPLKLYHIWQSTAVVYDQIMRWAI